VANVALTGLSYYSACARFYCVVVYAIAHIVGLIAYHTKCCRNASNFAHTGHGLVVLRNCCRDACAFLTPANAERYRSSASVSLSIHLLLSESSLLLSVELSTAAASYRRRCLFLGGVTARRCLGRRSSAVRCAGALSGGAGVVCTAGGRIHMSSSSSELHITIAAGPSVTLLQHVRRVHLQHLRQCLFENADVRVLLHCHW